MPEVVPEVLPEPEREPVTWLPAAWCRPQWVPLDAGHHLRPLAAADIDLQMAAVIGSRERIWADFGAAWGWPAPDLTRERELVNLTRTEAEAAAHESFVYAVFPEDERTLLGNVYVDPPGRPGADADVSWWLVEELAGSPLAARLESWVRRWIAEAWPFQRPRFLPADLTWAQWLDLPEGVPCPLAGDCGGMSTNDPIREASEADLAEQEQGLDGSGMLTEAGAPSGEANEADVLEQRQPLRGAEPAVAANEVDEADALEQGTEVTTDDDGYPHEAEER